MTTLRKWFYCNDSYKTQAIISEVMMIKPLFFSSSWAGWHVPCCASVVNLYKWCMSSCDLLLLLNSSTHWHVSTPSAKAHSCSSNLQTHVLWLLTDTRWQVQSPSHVNQVAGRCAQRPAVTRCCFHDSRDQMPFPSLCYVSLEFSGEIELQESVVTGEKWRESHWLRRNTSEGFYYYYYFKAII